MNNLYHNNIKYIIVLAFLALPLILFIGCAQPEANIRIQEMYIPLKSKRTFEVEQALTIYSLDQGLELKKDKYQEQLDYLYNSLTEIQKKYLILKQYILQTTRSYDDDSKTTE